MLENPWFIGISGGIISSIIVLLIKLLMNRINKKEYYNRIDEANGEVINIFRQVISEDDIPNKEIIESIINATSRKYKVKADDMNNVQMVIEGLITEIFSSNFISVDRKLMNSNNLLKIKGEFQEYQVNLKIEQLYKHVYERKSSPTSSIVSLLFMIIIVFTSLISLLFSEVKGGLIDISKFEVIPIMLGFLISILALTITMFATSKNIRNSNRDKDKDRVKRDDDNRSILSTIKRFFE